MRLPRNSINQIQPLGQFGPPIDLDQVQHMPTMEDMLYPVYYVVSPAVGYDDTDQVTCNYRLLEAAGRIGELFAESYAAVLEEQPSLADTRIAQASPRNRDYASAVPGWKMPDGKHTVYLPLYPAVMQDIATQPRRHPTAYTLIAGKLGLELEDMDTETSAKFMAAHEFGHVRLYEQCGNDPEEYEKIFRNETLIDELYARREPYKTQAMLDQAHRQQPDEIQADDFAAHVYLNRLSQA